MSNYKQTPGWVGAIRSGNFDQAEAELTQASAQRVHNQLEEQRAYEGVRRINEQAGHYSKYAMGPSIARVSEEVQQGRIQTSDQLLTRYNEVLNEEITQFRQDVRPGFMRSQTEPYTPADAEVRSYCEERRAQQEALKSEGRAIASVTPNSGNRR